jgi:hypothetical protein
MNDATDTFDRLLADEPPMTLVLDPVVIAGRGLRRRRFLAYRTGIALAGAAAVVTAAAVIPMVRAHDTANLLPGAPAPHALPQPPHAVHAETITDTQQKILDAIVGASPSRWQFEFGADDFDGDQGYDGVVDDGRGLTRLSVGISTATQIVHPCRDAEFRAGASCEERVQRDGSVLSLRGVAADGKVRTVTAVLTHPDGSGVNASSGNFTLDPATGGPKRDLRHVRRSAPPYTAEQLGDVVLAVDAALRG